MGMCVGAYQVSSMCVVDVGLVDVVVFIVDAVRVQSATS
jgi:hypothetical protein